MGKAKREKKPSLKNLALTMEILNNGGAGRELCQTCGLFRKCEAGFIRPTVPEDWTGKVLVVADSDEILHGSVGKLYRSIYRRAGFGDLDIAFAPAVRCWSGVAPSM